MTQLADRSSSALKSTAELQESMQYLLELAKQKGATDAAVTIEQDRGFSVDVRCREVDTVSFHDSQTMSVVVYCGQQQGSAGTSDLSPQSLAQIVDAAWNIAQVSAADPCFGLVTDTNLLCRHPEDLALCHPWALTPAEAIEMAKQCESLAFAQSPAIVNSEGVHVGSYRGCFGYANSRGSEAIVYSTRHQMSCALIAADADKKLQRDDAYTVARRAEHLLSPEAVAKKAAGRVLKRLGARKIKTQQVPVLFDATIATHLISNFVHAISGGLLYRKQTFLQDALGKVVFPEWMHLQEHPYLKEALGSSAFDADGVKTRENIFVDQGRVQQYVLSHYSARRLGLETTANAGGVHNLTVKSTHPDLNSLLKTMHTGLLVTELMGQGINLQTGDYSRGAYGFWVENGEIQFPVEEVTIAGRLQDMYGNFVGVGADRDPNHATQCGSILVAQMTVAGH